MADSLKELIRFANKNAETIFRRTGELLPMYHAITAGGEQMIIPQPNEDKDVSVALIKMLFAEHRVETYVFMSEAWMLDTTKQALQPDIRKVMQNGLQHHPDRREIVAFAAENRRGESQTASRFILRPEHGKATLAPLKMDDMSNRTSEGRMVGLLQKGEAR